METEDVYNGKYIARAPTYTRCNVITLPVRWVERACARDVNVARIIDGKSNYKRDDG